MENKVNRLGVFLVIFILSTSAQAQAFVDQKVIFKDWVLRRCLSYISVDKEAKKDALNTASAYLEQSTLSVEKLQQSEPLIKRYLAKSYQGSIKGTFNTKKCIDLFNNSELDKLYIKLKE